MIIGNGMIAKVFEPYKENNDVLIFASGVSNSKSTDPAIYQREFDLLKGTIEQHNGKRFIYFSTCSIYDPNEKGAVYVQHKEQIEKYIQATCSSYTVFRLSNLVGRSANKNTVLNFFMNCIHEDISFNLWTNATRNLIDVADVYSVVDYLIKNNLLGNNIVNIANPANYSVLEIIHEIELFYNKKAAFIPISKGDSFSIAIPQILPIFETLHIHFGSNYLKGLLNKYYS